MEIFKIVIVFIFLTNGFVFANYKLHNPTPPFDCSLNPSHPACAVSAVQSATRLQ